MKRNTIVDLEGHVLFKESMLSNLQRHELKQILFVNESCYVDYIVRESLRFTKEEPDIYLSLP